MSNETIADIAAEIRDIPGDMYDGTISMFEDEFHSYADRIEAAAKREECELLAQIAGLRQKIDDGKFFTPKAARDAIAGERPLDEMLKAPPPTGNAAAMREIVSRRSIKIPIEIMPTGNAAAMRKALERCVDLILRFGNAELIETPLDVIIDIEMILKDALRAAPRNCDEMPDIDKLTMNDLAKSPCKSTLECASREELLALVRWLLATAAERKGESDGK